MNGTQKRHPCFLPGSFFVLFSLLVSACGGSKFEGSNSTKNTADAASSARLIIAPPEAYGVPGEAVRFTVQAEYPSGAKVDVHAEATMTADNDLVAVDARDFGVAKLLKHGTKDGKAVEGESSVTVNFRGMQAQARIVIVPLPYPSSNGLARQVTATPEKLGQMQWSFLVKYLRQGDLIKSGQFSVHTVDIAPSPGLVKDATPMPGLPGWVQQEVRFDLSYKYVKNDHCARYTKMQIDFSGQRAGDSAFTLPLGLFLEVYPSLPGKEDFDYNKPCIDFVGTAGDPSALPQ